MYIQRADVIRTISARSPHFSSIRCFSLARSRQCEAPRKHTRLPSLRLSLFPPMPRREPATLHTSESIYIYSLSRGALMEVEERALRATEQGRERERENTARNFWLAKCPLDLLNHSDSPRTRKLPGFSLSLSLLALGF